MSKMTDLEIIVDVMINRRQIVYPKSVV